MKYKICIAFSSLLCLLLANCATEKKAAFDFPVSMSLADKARFSVTCHKGQILYDMNCSGCHNVKVKRKYVVPDFTQDQMSRYDLKSNNMKHDSSMVFSKVTPEELSQIYLFLIYKRKSNVPFKAPDNI